MGLSVKLNAFEGPLDLLLHLIDKNKINIYDIPISLITDQYMEYIGEAQEKNLDIMSEFLVMAATLLNIKSKMLLPKDPVASETEADPRQELVERLLEYKMYRYASLELKDRQIDAERVVFKGSSIPDEIASYKEKIDVKEILSDVTLSKLNTIFKSVMKKQIDKIDPIRVNFGRIEVEEVNLTKKMRFVQEYGLEHKQFWFRELLVSQRTKMDTIVTFLCILELIKIGRIRITQEELFDDIGIEYLANDIIEIDIT